MKPTLYLPLTEEKALALAAYNAHPAVVLSGWEISEIACALVIQNALSLDEHMRADKSEKSLAELITIGTQVDEAKGVGEFSRIIAARFDRLKFKAGLEGLSKIPARLLEQDVIEEGGFLDGEGKWDFKHNAELPARLNPLTEEFAAPDGKLFTLTSQQARTFKIFQSELDESLDVQAVAGGGKSFLVERMVDTLGRFQPLVLAYTQVQLKAIMDRVGSDRVMGMTFGQLATECLERDQTKPYRRGGKRARPSHQLRSDEIAKRLDFKSMGALSEWQVASICNRMLMKFCHSDDKQIGAQHIPLLDTPLSEVEKAVLVENARNYWLQTTEPTDPKLELPLRGYHRIKHLSLASDTFIDPKYTHILVDESHDLTWPMCSFLDRSTLPVITLGDACQRIDGNFSRRSPATRRREIFHSIRAGRQIEGVVNPLIERNPVIQVPQMEGSRSRDTKVVFYDTATIPTEPTTILCHSEWGVFEWFQRLGNASARFSLLPGVEKAFRMFVLDCIELYNNRVRPSHNALFKYTSWSSLRKDKSGNDPAFNRIEQMLNKGYTSSDFEASLQWLDDSGRAPIKLGRVSDARNTEVDCVMLAPDLLTNVAVGDKIGAAKAFASVYTGGTRAKFKLIVPGVTRDWATDISARARK